MYSVLLALSVLTATVVPTTVADPMCDSLNKAVACEQKTSSSTCGPPSDCSWNSGENKCDLSAEEGLKMLAVILSGNAGGLMGEAMKCQPKPQGSCSGNCEWKTDQTPNKCDVSTAYVLQQPGMSEVLPKAMACGQLTSAGKNACNTNADCQWKDNKCDVSNSVALVMFGCKAPSGGSGTASGSPPMAAPAGVTLWLFGLALSLGM